jgi:tRNA threonylcarbamoyladenosine biosynthesis protein TsaB
MSDGLAAGGSGLLLAVDTTGERCSACVYDTRSSRVLALAEPEIGKGHAERLMGVVDDVLAAAGAGYGDLERLAVAVGPGSFTGIRVGVSAIRGLSLALARPAVGVDVLEALAQPHLNAGSAVLAVQDARRGELYAALYAKEGSALRVPAALAAQSLPAFVASVEGQSLALVGSGAGIASAQLAHARIVSSRPEPSIAAVAAIGARRGTGAPVRPLYLRQADAKPSSTPRLVRAT